MPNMNQMSNMNQMPNSSQKSGMNPAPNMNQKSGANPAPNMNQTPGANPTPNASEARPGWMDNPALSGIDPAKLQMLTSMAAQAQGKNQNELLSFLMTAASQSQANHMAFQPDEIDAIVNVMKIGKSPQEIQKIDRICSLFRQFRRFS